MEPASLALGVGLGLAAGGFVAWTLARQRAVRENAALASRNAVLEERLVATERARETNESRASALAAQLAEVDAARDRAERELAAADERARQVEPLKIALRDLRAEKDALADARAQLESRIAAERQAADELRVLFEANTAKLREAFQALAAQALQANNESFLKLAETRLKETQTQATGDIEARKKEVEALVKPLQESLKGLDDQARALETKRVQAYAELTTQVTQLMGAQQKLQSETGNLVMALRAPHVRGRWGEVGLRRLVEMAGMLEHCDFEVQHQVETEQGRQQPDMIIHLPGARTIIVDSKAPLPEFLSPNEMNDEAVRARWLQANARAVRDHMTALSAKEYWTRLESSPDMVILFLPTESVYFAVREQDPGLVEFGIDKKIALLTPATLIPVLHTIAFAWRRESLTENAEAMRKLGNELHTRMVKFLEHFDRARKGLETAVKGFNDATGSLEQRVLPAARKFKELGATSQDELESVNTIEVVPRELHAPEARPEAKIASELPPFELAPAPPPVPVDP